MKVSPRLSDSASLLSNLGCQALIVEYLNDSLTSTLVLEVQECSRNFGSYFNINLVECNKYPYPTVMENASQLLKVQGLYVKTSYIYSK
jgi:hypothetical protein